MNRIIIGYRVEFAVARLDGEETKLTRLKKDQEEARPST
jgi:hypothetical protein